MNKKLFFFLMIPILTFSQIKIGQDINGEAAYNYLGYSVSLSSDGTILAIGTPNNHDNGNQSGLVRIYQNQSGTWTQIGNDIKGEAGDYSGKSVSLSSDGTIVAIGSPYNSNKIGHVKIYQNQSGTWIQIGSKIDGKITNDALGTSVSLSSDGTVVAIGTLDDEAYYRGNYVGIYQSISGTWTQIGNDIIGEGGDNLSGFSVSLSSNGTMVAIGGPWNDNINGIGSGHVRIYQNISGTWTQVGSDIDGEAEWNNFGWSVSLSSDGTVVAIGANGNNGSGEYSGHVRIYENQSGIWTQLGSDIDGEAAGDYSGWSVSLSSDGNVVAIGAYLNDGNGVDSGHVRIYQNQSGTWTQLGNDMDGEASNDQSGWSVSLSSNGNVVAIGAIGKSSYFGQVLVYDLTALLSTESFNKDYFSFYPNPVKDVLNINLNKGLELKQVNIYNIQSQYLYSIKTSKIDVRNLTSGIYFIEVETNQGKSAKKFIVE